MRRVVAAVLCALALLGTVAGCGGGGDSSSTTAGEATMPPAVRAKANAVCRGFERELKAIGDGALANPPQNTPELITQRLVAPTIPVLKKVAARQQALSTQADNASFTLYANLFDPAIILAEKRLQAGKEEDMARAHGLEEQLTNLAETQRRAARDAGLVDCEIDFSHVLLASVSE